MAKVLSMGFNYHLPRAWPD